MKQILFFLFSLLILASCGPSENKVRITGKFKSLNKGVFFVFTEKGGWNSFDTIQVEDGEFSYDRELTEPAIVTIQYPNFSQMTIIAEPGKTIKIEGDARNLSTTKVSGTPGNEILTKFRVEMLEKPVAEVQKAAVKFIKENAADIVSEAILYTYLLKNEKLDAKVLLPLLDLLGKAQPANLSLRSTIVALRPLLLSEEGQKLPHFSCITLEGKKIDNKRFKDHYLLINFWAEWITNSYNQISTLSTFSSKKIAFVNVSLDFNKESYLERLRSDSLPGHNVCDGFAWSSPLVKALGVRFVPGNILVNPSGVILARDLTTDELTRKLNAITNE